MGVVEILGRYIYDIIVGAITLLVGFGAGILLKKITYQLFKEIGLNAILSKADISLDVERWFSSILSYIVYLVTIVIFLDQLGIKSIVVYLILGAILMLFVLTLVVGLKDIVPNFIGWIVIQKRGNIKEGRQVHVREIAGKILHVGYLETEIETEHHDILYVPNALFLKSKFRMKKD